MFRQIAPIYLFSAPALLLVNCTVPLWGSYVPPVGLKIRLQAGWPMGSTRVHVDSPNNLHWYTTESMTLATPSFGVLELSGVDVEDRLPLSLWSYYCLLPFYCCWCHRQRHTSATANRPTMTFCIISTDRLQLLLLSTLMPWRKYTMRCWRPLTAVMVTETQRRTALRYVLWHSPDLVILSDNELQLFTLMKQWWKSVKHHCGL